MMSGNSPDFTYPDLIYPEWAAPDGIRAISTTRSGGVSHSPYESLNLGMHVQDNPEHVHTNRLALPLPNQPVWLQQVHGNDIVELCGNESGSPTADACFSTRQGVVCGILTADCLPILLCDKKGEFVAAVHGGWRGLQQDIIACTVAHYSGNASDLMMWTGPAIGPAAFEVGEEVKEAFSDFGQAFLPARSKGKYLADLSAIAALQAQACGVGQISASGHCTYSQPEKFFSYRRDGITGRMGTFIWIS